MIRAVGIVVVSCLLAVVFTRLDRDVIFVYLPRWLIVGVPSVALAAAIRPPKLWIQRGAVVALAVWGLAVLPRIRWNELKAFYIDCTDVRPGMTLTEARSRMFRYVEAGRTGIQVGDGTLDHRLPGATVVGVAETDAEHATRILFIPSQQHGADWCLIYPDGDRVARVEIAPD